MPVISDIRKDIEFYQNFSSLVEVLKAIAVSHFRTLEKKIMTFEEFMRILESFFDMLDMRYIRHPFVQTGDRPLGVVAITSNVGLLGGLNHRVMVASLNYVHQYQGRLIVVGQQGQRVAQGYDISFKSFNGAEDDMEYGLALELRDYIVEEVLNFRIGPVKVIYPIALSISTQRVLELNLLPCTDWTRESHLGSEGDMGDDTDILLESYPRDLAEYLTYLWLVQKFIDILQSSRLAEYAARTIHLEESAQKIKEIDKKLQLKYHRARHEIIDQQMRELYSARSLYAE
jgi:ATP synthase F1 gamma subunit